MFLVIPDLPDPKLNVLFMQCFWKSSNRVSRFVTVDILFDLCQEAYFVFPITDLFGIFYIFMVLIYDICFFVSSFDLKRYS